MANPVIPVGSSTLQAIQTKVRRITRSPSTAQLSNNDINQYINTFLLFDLPTSLKLFSLRTVLEFYTQPGQDVYKTNTTNPQDPLYDFQNIYTNIHEPVFVAGVQAFFTQERNVFYGNWPQTNFVQRTGLFGNGTMGPFSGHLPPSTNFNPQSQMFPYILQGSVLFTALSVQDVAMQIVDTPTIGFNGDLNVPNGDPAIPLGTINYLTGAFSFTFPDVTADNSPQLANPIWSEAIYYVAGLPTTVLYYNNEFTIRPVPDKSYIVQVEANIIPSALLQTTDNPDIKQWWQLIALGAAIKIFQDRMDLDSVNLIMPEFEKQQALVNSTSLDQYTNQRTQTIYYNSGTTSWRTWGNWPY